MPRGQYVRSTFWNEERVNILTANWPTMSGGDIALMLGTTRNTVIGKAHRLKLAPKRRAPTPGVDKRARLDGLRAKRRREQRKASPAAISAPPEPIPPPQPTEYGLSIFQLQEHHCREIVGSGEDGLARYCGAPKAGLLKARIGQFHSSYCAEHSGKNYQLPSPPR